MESTPSVHRRTLFIVLLLIVTYKHAVVTKDKEKEAWLLLSRTTMSREVISGSPLTQIAPAHGAGKEAV